MTGAGAKPSDQASSFLARVPIFASLDEEDLHRLLAIAGERTYRKGSTIFFENDPGEALYVILAGRVKVYKLAADGREKILAILGPGEYFGEMSLLDGLPRSASTEAMETTRLLMIQRQEFLSLLSAHPSLALKVIAELSRRLRQANAQVEELAFLDVRGRVARGLLALVAAHGSPHPAGQRIDLRLTHKELASYCGAARETVTRVLLELQDSGAIEVDGHRIVVVDRAALEELAR
ncbi:MAG: Crp/Fnr family transcriptional regulator [Bacillota bacterium]|nr:Crp/Fnr family transcriptional regulator [Bacillota bacterium]